MHPLRRSLRVSSSDARRAIDMAVAEWGGEWVERGCEAWLPVSAGIRRGLVRVEVSLEEAGDGVTVELLPRERHFRVNKGAAGVLALGALGGVVGILWPFYPALLRFAPIAAVLAVVAWLMVAGRLRSHGPEEFLELVTRLIGDD